MKASKREMHYKNWELKLNKSGWEAIAKPVIHAEQGEIIKISKEVYELPSVIDNIPVYKIDMQEVFKGLDRNCEIDMSLTDFSNIRDASGMFSSTNTNIAKAYEIKANWSTLKPMNVGGMFDGQALLREIDLSHMGISRCESMTGMFFNCALMEKVYFAKGRADKLRTMKGMFGMCLSLKGVDISNLVIDTDTDTEMTNMFYGCSELEEVILPTIFYGKRLYCENTFKIDGMFQRCRNLKTVRFRDNVGIKFRGLYPCTDDSYSAMFLGCDSLELADLGGIKNIHLKQLFQGEPPRGLIILCDKDAHMEGGSSTVIVEEKSIEKARALQKRVHLMGGNGNVVIAVRQ